MRFGSGLLLVSLGFLAMLTGVGTSDMEAAIGENVRAFTGLPLAVLGVIALAAGMWLITGEERHKPSERRESKRRAS